MILGTIKKGLDASRNLQPGVEGSYFADKQITIVTSMKECLVIECFFNLIEIFVTLGPTVILGRIAYYSGLMTYSKDADWFVILVCPSPKHFLKVPLFSKPPPLVSSDLKCFVYMSVASSASQNHLKFSGLVKVHTKSIVRILVYFFVHALLA